MLAMRDNLQSVRGIARRAARGLVTRLALVALVLAASGPLRAEPSGSADLARSVAVAGREAYNAGDYKTALDLFRRAYSMYAAPTLSLYEARSLEKLGRLREADEALRRTIALPVAADAPPQFAEAIETAREERTRLLRRIPTLTIHVNGEALDGPLKLSLNEQPLASSLVGQKFPLDPGTYEVVATLPDGRRDHVRLEIADGHHVDAVLDLGRPARAVVLQHHGPTEPGPSWQPPLAYGAFALGGVGLVTGAVTGIMASSKHSRADELCPGRECTPGSEGADALESFRSLRTVSTAAYGVGAAGLAAGLILWLSMPDDRERPDVASVQPWLEGRFAGVQGAFH